MRTNAFSTLDPFKALVSTKGTPSSAANPSPSTVLTCRSCNGRSILLPTKMVSRYSPGWYDKKSIIRRHRRVYGWWTIIKFNKKRWLTNQFVNAKLFHAQKVTNTHLRVAWPARTTSAHARRIPGRWHHTPTALLAHHDCKIDNVTIKKQIESEGKVL